MAETKVRKEKFTELPNDLLDKFNGFSLDFGEYAFHLFCFFLFFLTRKYFCENSLGKSSFLMQIFCNHLFVFSLSLDK